jgi:hypothetical protein
MLNVFAVPGEVFNEVKGSRPATSNWLVPVIFMTIVGVLSALVIFSQPAIVQQIREAQEKAIEQKVQQGKMTQQQADQAEAVMDKFMGATFFKIFGVVGSVFASFWRVFWWGLVLWLMGRKIFKAEVAFSKALEVAGLAMMISVLGGIVAVLLSVNLSRAIATPSLALAVQNFDMTRKSHWFLGAANVFSFWQVGVTSVGLARLAGVPFLRAAWVVATFWVFEECVLIMIGMGQFAL